MALYQTKQRRDDRATIWRRARPFVRVVSRRIFSLLTTDGALKVRLFARFPTLTFALRSHYSRKYNHREGNSRPRKDAARSLSTDVTGVKFTGEISWHAHGAGINSSLPTQRASLTYFVPVILSPIDNSIAFDTDTEATQLNQRGLSRKMAGLITPHLRDYSSTCLSGETCIRLLRRCLDVLACIKRTTNRYTPMFYAVGTVHEMRNDGLCSLCWRTGHANQTDLGPQTLQPAKPARLRRTLGT